jgi:hypothetical protein
MAKGEVFGQSRFCIEGSFYLQILDNRRRDKCWEENQP